MINKNIFNEISIHHYSGLIRYIENDFQYIIDVIEYLNQSAESYLKSSFLVSFIECSQINSRYSRTSLTHTPSYRTKIRGGSFQVTKSVYGKFELPCTMYILYNL